jgi:hypothetical protein|tara:strand:+ start:42 stop:251 length:210 start_codon:yes stop_codon:yes gene_type:complete
MADGYRKKVGSGIKVKEIDFYGALKKEMGKQQAGQVSTIAGPSNAKKFVDIRTRIKKAGGYKRGGTVKK